MFVHREQWEGLKAEAKELERQLKEAQERVQWLEGRTGGLEEVRDSLLADRDKALERARDLRAELEIARDELDQERRHSREYRAQHPPDEAEARRLAEKSRQWDKLLSYNGRGEQEDGK